MAHLILLEYFAKNLCGSRKKKGLINDKKSKQIDPLTRHHKSLRQRDGRPELMLQHALVLQKDVICQYHRVPVDVNAL